jgi:hypothetical protein
MLLVIAPAFLAAACAQGPERVSETGPTVTYSYDNISDRAEADDRAVRYCADFGLDARLLDTDERSGTLYAVYECV